MPNNKHQAMLDYLGGCPGLTPLFFGFSEGKPGAWELRFVASDDCARRFIDGRCLKYYTFALTYLAPLTADCDENLEAVAEPEAVMDWLRAQNRVRNLPDFGADCHVERVVPLQDAPTAEGRDVRARLAAYRFQGRVEYVSEE